MSHVVIGACAYFTTISPLDGKPYKTLLYTGSLVPDSALPEEIEHNLASGLIGPVEDLADLDEVILLEPEPVPAVVVEEPARNASTEVWQEYALSKGAVLEDIASLKRDELVELFGTPAGS